jgi:Sulfotransferase family
MKEEGGKAMEPTQTVIVLGVNRSGTSLIAGALHRLGVRMGPKGVHDDSWTGVHWQNPNGHFENRDFNRLSQAILGTSSYSFSLPDDWAERLRAADPRPIRELIERTQGGRWGWKDPSTLATLPAFLPYLTNAYFVVVQRNSRSVAASLARSSGTSVEVALKVIAPWEERLRSLLDTPEIRDRAIVLQFEEFGRGGVPFEEAARNLSRFLGLPEREEAFRYLADEFFMTPSALATKSRRLAVRELSTFPKYVLWLTREKLSGRAPPGSLILGAKREFTATWRAAAKGN